MNCKAIAKVVEIFNKQNKHELVIKWKAMLDDCLHKHYKKSTESI